jgi:AraC-like DNA-binding protein
MRIPSSPLSRRSDRQGRARAGSRTRPVARPTPHRVLRAWFARPEAETPGWYQAHSDPVVGPALRLLHNDPSPPWTVATLAAASGTSRAALARRFNELVGEPPMTFLTTWRLALAADLLLEPGATVDSVARQVGYGSSFALSTAFKRVRGISHNDTAPARTVPTGGPVATPLQTHRRFLIRRRCRTTRRVVVNVSITDPRGPRQRRRFRMCMRVLVPLSLERTWTRSHT